MNFKLLVWIYTDAMETKGDRLHMVSLKILLRCDPTNSNNVPNMKLPRAYNTSLPQ